MTTSHRHNQNVCRRNSFFSMRFSSDFRFSPDFPRFFGRFFQKLFLFWLTSRILNGKKKRRLFFSSQFFELTKLKTRLQKETKKKRSPKKICIQDSEKMQTQFDSNFHKENGWSFFFLQAAQQPNSNTNFFSSIQFQSSIKSTFFFKTFPFSHLKHWLYCISIFLRFFLCIFLTLNITNFYKFFSSTQELNFLILICEKWQVPTNALS